MKKKDRVKIKKEQTGIEPVTAGPAIPRSTAELLLLITISNSQLPYLQDLAPFPFRAATIFSDCPLDPDTTEFTINKKD